MIIHACVDKGDDAEDGKHHFRIQRLGQKREGDREHKETEHDAQEQSLYSLYEHRNCLKQLLILMSILYDEGLDKHPIST